MPKIFSLRVFSKPLITERTTIRAMTPTMTPAMEIMVMMEMKVCFRLALRYLRPINHSYFIFDIDALLFADLRLVK